MSLISPKNFIAPFTNAVSLVTIIVVALLFAIYRLSGGGVGITTRKTPPQVVKPLAVVKEKEAPVEVIPRGSSLRPPEEDSTFDDLLDRGRDKAPVKPQPTKPSGSSIDDIAKQLGVR